MQIPGLLSNYTESSMWGSPSPIFLRILWSGGPIFRPLDQNFRNRPFCSVAVLQWSMLTVEYHVTLTWGFLWSGSRLSSKGRKIFMAVVKPGEAWSAGGKKLTSKYWVWHHTLPQSWPQTPPLTNSKVEERGESGLEQGSHGSMPRIQVWSVDSQHFSPCSSFC